MLQFEKNHVSDLDFQNEGVLTASYSLTGFRQYLFLIFNCINIQKSELIWVETNWLAIGTSAFNSFKKLTKIKKDIISKLLGA